MTVDRATFERLARSGVKKAGIELYATRRYIAVTGNIYGELRDIADRTTAVRHILDDIAQPTPEPTTKTKPAKQPATGVDALGVGIDLADLDATPDTPAKQRDREYLLNQARRAKGMGSQFVDHFDNGVLRNSKQRDGDTSATDYWIIRNLVFWFRADPVEIQRAFVSSNYYSMHHRDRDKWYSPRGDSTYGGNLIGQLIAEPRKYYEPDSRHRLVQFIQTTCTVGPEFTVPLQVLYDLWCEWCQQHSCKQPFPATKSFSFAVKKAFPEGNRSVSSSHQ